MRTIFDVDNNIIKDHRLWNLYKEFEREYTENLKGHTETWKNELRELVNFISSIRLEELNWELVNEYIVANDTKLRGAVIDFFLMIIQKGHYCADDENIVYEYKRSIIDFFNQKRTNYRDVIWPEHVNPYSIITFVGPENLPGGEKKDITRFVIIPNADKQLHEFLCAILDYVHKKYKNPVMYKGIFGVLQTIYGNYDGVFSKFEDFNDDSFLTHYNLVYDQFTSEKKKAVDRVRDGYVIALIELYIYIELNISPEKLNENFNTYRINILRYQGLRFCLDNGFKVINYNIYDSFPTEPKLLINSGEMHTRGSGLISTPVMFDVSEIKNNKLRNWVLECFWMDDNHILSTRAKLYSDLIIFACMLSERLDKNELDICISVEDILRYKEFVVSQKVEDATKARKLSIVKYFLKFLDDRNYMVIGALQYKVLKYHDSKLNENKDAYSDDEIDKLRDGAKYYNNLVDDPDRKLKYQLIDILFQILFISCIRYTNLLETRCDSLIKTLSREGKDEYKLCIRSKNAGDKYCEYNITRTVKDLITEASELTSNLREVAIGPEKDYIFIFRANSHREIAMINDEAVRNYHKNVCELMDIPYLGIGAIRNYYMNIAGKYASKKNTYEKSISALTGHSISVQNKYYEKTNILDFCEKFYQVEIGDIHISGRVENNYKNDNSHTVMEGCGKCSLDRCIFNGLLDCYMCKDFVTTPEHLPFFEMAIEKIDKDIISQNIVHEKEFLVAKKALMVAYVAKLNEKINRKDD